MAGFLVNMSEAEYQQIMAAGAAAEAQAWLDWPRCHFTRMEWHESDSNPNYSGYQCKHCGHTKEP